MVKLGRWYKDEYNEYTMPLVVDILKDKLTAIISLPDTRNSDSEKLNYILTDRYTDTFGLMIGEMPKLQSKSFSRKLPRKTMRKALKAIFTGKA
jgi:hypothetical protein